MGFVNRFDEIEADPKFPVFENMVSRVLQQKDLKKEFMSLTEQKWLL